MQFGPSHASLHEQTMQRSFGFRILNKLLQICQSLKMRLLLNVQSILLVLSRLSLQIIKVIDG